MKAGGLLVAPFDLRIVTVATGLATVLFLAGSVVAWRVMADRLGPRAATAGLALLAFSPAAYAFSLVYAESLFLLLAAASFLAGGHGRAAGARGARDAHPHRRRGTGGVGPGRGGPDARPRPAAGPRRGRRAGSWRSGRGSWRSAR